MVIDFTVCNAILGKHLDGRFLIGRFSILVNCDLPVDRVSFFFHLGQNILQPGCADTKCEFHTRANVQHPVFFQLLLERVGRRLKYLILMDSAFLQPVTYGTLLFGIAVQFNRNGCCTHTALIAELLDSRDFKGFDFFLVLGYLCPELRSIHLHRLRDHVVIHALLPKSPDRGLKILHMLVCRLTGTIAIPAGSNRRSLKHTSSFMPEEAFFISLVLLIELIIAANINLRHGRSPPLSGSE